MLLKLQFLGICLFRFHSACAYFDVSLHLYHLLLMTLAVVHDCQGLQPLNWTFL